MTPNLKLLTGNANPALARDICDCLDLELCRAEVKTFSDGEINVALGENVRGMDVFVIQPTCTPANTKTLPIWIVHVQRLPIENPVGLEAPALSKGSLLALFARKTLVKVIFYIEIFIFYTETRSAKRLVLLRFVTYGTRSNLL